MTLSKPQVKCEDDSGFQEETVSNSSDFEKSGNGDKQDEKPTTRIKLGRGKQSIVLEFEDDAGRNFEATVDISDICIKFKGFVQQFDGKNSHGKKVDVDTSSQDSKHSDETTATDKSKGSSEVDRFSDTKPLTIPPSRVEELKRVLTFPQVLKSPLKDTNKIPEKHTETIKNCVDKLKVNFQYSKVNNSEDEKENKVYDTSLAKSMASNKNPDDTKLDFAAVNKKLNEEEEWLVKSSKQLKDLSNLIGNSKNKKEDLINSDKSSKNHSSPKIEVEKASNDPTLNVLKQAPKCSIDPIPSWEEFSKELSHNQKLFTLGKSKKIQTVNKKSSVTPFNSTFEIPKENSTSPFNSKCPNEKILPRSSSSVASRTMSLPKYEKPISALPAAAKSTGEKVVPSAISADFDRNENSLKSITKPTQEKSIGQDARITSDECQNLTDSAEKLVKEKDEVKCTDFSTKSIENEAASIIDSVAKPTSEQEPITNPGGLDKDIETVSKHETISLAQKSTVRSISDLSQKDSTSKLKSEIATQKLDLVNETSNVKETKVSSSDYSTSSPPDSKLSIPLEAKISCRTIKVESEVKCVNEKLQGRSSQLVENLRSERASSAEISIEQKPVVREVQSSQKSTHDGSSELRNLSHDQSSSKVTNETAKRVTLDATPKPIEQKPIASVKGCPRRNVTNERSSEPSPQPPLQPPSQPSRPNVTASSTSNDDHSSVRRRTDYESDLYGGGLFESLLRDLQFSSPVSRLSSLARTDIFEENYREPVLNISGIGRTKKFNAFMQCPGGKRPVTDLPGVGDKGGQRLRALGFETAGKLHQQYLRFGRDKSVFQSWLWTAAGLNRRWSSQCFDALELMD
ncbi:uncharacterized protein DDB_G0284459-like isoform X2 [Planococcus citri]|uniref:uncharacterized protein DDB_G0284459-like isoform X2 n=1 Tax=Planococcus citri TaxID=170843 RepID=UPI0031F84442